VLPMTIFLTAFAVSLAWAIYAALTTERRHRAAWSEVEQPAIEGGDPPYRSAAVRPRLGRAPGLVRLTAFACLWIGQAAAVVMFVPAILFWRGGGIAIGTIESTASWRHSTIAYDLGPLLLQRHRHALPAASAVVHMLRIVAGALAVFAAFGLLGVAASEPAWWIILGYAASAALLAGLLSFLARRHSGAFVHDATSDGSVGSVERERAAVPYAAGDDLPSLLVRGDGSTSAWVEVLLTRAASYRSAVRIDDLWSVLESADAPLGARAAAAIALGPSLDADGRRRFRGVKEDAPYPLRLALKAARGADTAAMVKALERCADD
jgi:hypothetical protein